MDSSTTAPPNPTSPSHTLQRIHSLLLTAGGFMLPAVWRGVRQSTPVLVRFSRNESSSGIWESSEETAWEAAPAPAHRM
ncbi:hypothetical protein GUJ93_ZPchr0001g32922 [Zizania palustris]|uniref:Uncharacterized protein n=1 Tax=Zizania palustris TaxID=103762 RepID=A0A8J5V819_ZIZPA|nr:hypothetical protein GUJ93_ZPchr0001g32922 [Zizania palustris]